MLDSKNQTQGGAEMNEHLPENFQQSKCHEHRQSQKYTALRPISLAEKIKCAVINNLSASTSAA
ncbi:hypothetical protein GP5015_1007 [gamma proteobacterium HTCC5015]|nr:hypothetical protein GP5015_1007 [gamma proteobacterium HTCC5015]